MPCSSSPGTAGACNQGSTSEEAAVKAIDTSGRAVLFAGSTVCIALLGILVLGISFLNGLAVASALTVVFTVLAAVTLLPALLGVFGIRVLSPPPAPSAWGPGAARRRSGLWSRWAGTVQRQAGCARHRGAPRSCWCSRSRC